MDAVAIERTARDLALSDAGLDEVYAGFDELARRLVHVDASVWSTLDPASGLMTSCTVVGIPKDPDREARVFAHEFSDDEPNSLLSMLAEQRTTAILSETTGGELGRAGRFREVGEPLGVRDELRALGWAGGVAWSMVAFFRGDGPYVAADARAIAALCPWLAHAVRLTLLRAAAQHPRGLDDPPGVVRVDVAGRVTALTEPAERWLEFGGNRLRTSAAATAAALRARAEWDGARTLVVADDAVLVLTGASLVGESGDVAVIVDRARKPHLAPVLLDAYGLTDRQRDVLGSLLLGHSISQIARVLGISEHTVHDHRKAIYRTFDVSSRSELAALLQHELYVPLRDRRLLPSPYGGFLVER